MNEQEVKGVIFAAGYGTRFLPASKTVPKELFPLIDVPAIDFTVKEFLDSGIDDILIITSRRKKVLEDYLDHEMELERILQQEGAKGAEKLHKIEPLKANFHFVRQREMKGTADALRLCKSFCGDSPFVVAYPDDLIFSEVPCSKQLIEVYRQTGKSVLSVKDLHNEDVSRYGVIGFSKHEGNVFDVTELVEKPPKGTEPSKVVSLGRYLYTSDIFEALDHIPEKANGEISQTEPLNYLAKKGKVVALEFEGKRFDVGAPFGYLTTIVEYALTREDLAPRFKKYLNENFERLTK